MPDGNWHVFPDDERADHKLKGTDCECVPRILPESGSIIVAHDAFDGRQAVEQAEALMRKSHP